MVQEYTTAQVLEHNSSNSVWIIIHNDIYDVTAYLNEHPGGEEVLLETAGKDGTEAFDDAGHSSDAKEVMLKYKIGTLVASERKPDKPKKLEWSQCSFKSCIIPSVAVGLVATLLFYRFYLRR